MTRTSPAAGLNTGFRKDTLYTPSGGVRTISGVQFYTHTTCSPTSLKAAGGPPACIRRPEQCRGANPDQSAEASWGSYTTSTFWPASGAGWDVVDDKEGAGAAVGLTHDNGSLSRNPSNLLRAACSWSQDCVPCARGGGWWGGQAGENAGKSLASASNAVFCFRHAWAAVKGFSSPEGGAGTHNQNGGFGKIS